MYIWRPRDRRLIIPSLKSESQMRRTRNYFLKRWWWGLKKSPNRKQLVFPQLWVIYLAHLTMQTKGSFMNRFSLFKCALPRPWEGAPQGMVSHCSSKFLKQAYFWSKRSRASHPSEITSSRSERSPLWCRSQLLNKSKRRMLSHTAQKCPYRSPKVIAKRGAAQHSKKARSPLRGSITSWSNARACSH